MKKVNILILVASLFFAVNVIGQGELDLKVLDLRIDNKYAEENSYRTMQPDFSPLPIFEEVQDKLPRVVWPARKDIVNCHDAAWKIAFGNLYQPTPESGFVSPFIDAAFNKHIFMWDTGFMLMFGRYGSNAFDFQGSLNNFYARQHRDGFICREIRRADGTDVFERYDLSSTGPNILPWVEWEYFLNFNDVERLEKIFPALLSYYQWFNTYRTWQDGSYFSSGWGCGVDNQPRLPEGINSTWGQGHMSWIDITTQAILAGNVLIAIADEIGRADDVKEIKKEVEYLTTYVNENMWDDDTAYYFDRFKDGSLSSTKSVVAYWSLLANVVPKDRIPRFIAHLTNKDEFDRPVRIPALSADNSEYRPEGEYWNGGVWAPVTYMVLRGLTKCDSDSLAHEIGLNSLNNVLQVYKDTGTFWEHYAPEKHKGMGVKDFVGWTGLIPISILYEYILGFRPDVPNNTLVWDVRLLDEHGIENYPFGKDGILSLKTKKRKKETDRPQINVKSNTDLNLQLIWKGGSETIKVKGNKK